MKVLYIVIMLAMAAGCAKESTSRRAFVLSPTTLKDRQMQTRSFDTTDESKILASSAAVLQDLGFTVEESAPSLGVITARKERSAIETAKKTMAIISAIFSKSSQGAVYDKSQDIYVTLVTEKAKSRKAVNVRINILRTVTNTQGSTRAEPIMDAEIYQEFFNKLGQSVFLNANEI